MASLLFPPGYRVVDDNGKPVSGAKIYVFEAGTTTPYTTHQNIALSTAHAHPIVCNSGGLPVNSSNTKTLVYLTGGDNVKVRVTTSADVTLWEYDNFPPYVSDGGTVPVNTGGTGATDAAGARTNLGAAAASDLLTLSSTVSGIDGQLDGIGGTLGDMAAEDDVGRDNLATGFGTIVLQRAVIDTDATVISCNAAIPNDNSIPQNTEGVEVLNGNFTPISASSKLAIEFQCMGASSTTNQRTVGIALFQDSVANALFATGMDTVDDGPVQLSLAHDMDSPGTSQIALKIRVGITSGSTFYVNANTSGTRLFGGVSEARLVVTEYLAV